MTSAIQKVEQASGALIPANSMDDVVRLGELFERSGMFGCSQQGQGAVLVLTCMAEHISPLQFKRTYHIIEGNPAMRADAMLAKFVELGGTYKIQAYSAQRAAAKFVYGENAMDLEVTMEQAKAAGWPFKKDGKTIKDNWARTPDAMLWARLVSKAVRLLAPGVNAGCYTPEEVHDFDAPAPRRDPAPVVGLTADAPKKVETAVVAPPVIDVPAEPVPAPAAVVVEQPVVNVDVCPVGKIAGKTWADLDTDTLLVVIGAKTAAVTAAHRARVAEVISARGGLNGEQQTKFEQALAALNGKEVAA